MQTVYSNTVHQFVVGIRAIFVDNCPKPHKEAALQIRMCNLKML